MYGELVTTTPSKPLPVAVVNCYGPHRADQPGGESRATATRPSRPAVINKRAGGQGLIVGRKAFQRPMAEGIELLHAIGDVYLDDSITIA